MSSDPRAIFVSDVHLGCKYANAEAFCGFLHQYEPEYLYLVGDFFDGWRLKRRWYWHDCYSDILCRLLELTRTGTRLFYTPGNHDGFLRAFLTSLGNISIANEFIHVTADSRRLLVTHGDQFDKVTTGHQWLSRLGDTGYNMLMGANRAFNGVWCRVGGSACYFSKLIKQRVKEITNALSNFETTVSSYASAMGCQGIVCGHIHVPNIVERPDGITYYNTGDWVENCSALVESADGKLQILHAT